MFDREDYIDNINFLLNHIVAINGLYKETGFDKIKQFKNGRSNTLKKYLQKKTSYDSDDGSPTYNDRQPKRSILVHEDENGFILDFAKSTGSNNHRQVNVIDEENMFDPDFIL